MSKKHLIFYDGQCGLCDHVVLWLLKRDKKEIFVFAPLQGKNAAKILKDIPDHIKKADSLILVENFETFHIYGKAAFRTLWLLGGPWKFLGLFNFLPPFLYNWGYRLVAKNRKLFFPKKVCILPDPEKRKRFLD